MNITSKSPLAFFAKRILLCPLGAAGVVVSMMRGAVMGIFVPLLLSRLLGQLENPQFIEEAAAG